MTGSGGSGDRSRRRGRNRRDLGPRPLKDGLGEAVAGLRGRPGRPAGPRGATLFSSWAEICGPAVARHARPVRLTSGTLEVVVDHPAWATELRLQSSTVLPRVSAAVGETVDRLVVRVRPGLWSDPGEDRGGVG